jgi:diguanylate cyclase (GGDEF)-like protein
MHPALLRSIPVATTLLLGAAAAARAQAAPAADSARALVEQAERLQDVDDARALRLAERALALLGPSGDRALRNQALGLQCWSSAGTAEPAALVALAERGMARAGADGDRRAEADLRLCRGYGQEAAGRLDEAAADFDFGAAQGRRLGNDRLLADALVFRGELRYFRGDMGRALEDLKQAYELYVRVGKASRRRYALNAIANLYADARVGEYDRAIEYYRQLLAANQTAGLPREVATGYYNLAGTYESKGDLPAALAYYRRAMEMERRLGDADEAAYTGRSVGVVLTKQGHPARALPWLDAAIAAAGRARDVDRMAAAQLSRGVALRSLGRVREALADLDAARTRYEAARNTRFLERVHGERALAFAAAGDWERAYQARTEQLRYQGELAEQLKEEHTSRLRVQFDTEKKEAENRALLRENRLRGQALKDAERIRSLQAAVLALALGIAAVLGFLVVRHVRGERLMRVIALTDELTRLPNRRHVLELADRGLAAARRTGEPFSLLALDVDRFKEINDRYGHEAGDQVLRRVAQACRGTLRHDDAMGRTGGEEFVVVLPRADLATAREVAERLRAAVEGLDWSAVAPGLHVTVSLGAAERTPADGTFADLSRRADHSLYRAKEGGRNRVEVGTA